MSASEQEFSECSEFESPQSCPGSAHSSPSQQVPFSSRDWTKITCLDDIFMLKVGKRPYLRIIEQPQEQYRFRYKSERDIGSHGYLLGRSGQKTYPTVELVNYTGKAVIKCQLWQSDKNAEHPHKLYYTEREDSNVNLHVPDEGSYKVCALRTRFKGAFTSEKCTSEHFRGMGIIHTAKKDVRQDLFQKLAETSNNVNIRQLRAQCTIEAKTIDLNIVRLRFSAHDITTDRELCPPVYSEQIYNMKSAATNELRICRASRAHGRARGGDDVMLLVEKVSKKNIKIQFYEEDENGDRTWSTLVHLTAVDVHHQYGIVFRTPAYKDPSISSDAAVYMELVRPSDGRTSAPVQFVYKADAFHKHNKRRKNNSTVCSPAYSPDSSVQSPAQVPAAAMMAESPRAFPIPASRAHTQVPGTPTPALPAATSPQLYDCATDLPADQRLQLYKSEAMQINESDFDTNSILEEFIFLPVSQAANTSEATEDSQFAALASNPDVSLLNDPMLGQQVIPNSVVTQPEQALSQDLFDASDIEEFFKCGLNLNEYFELHNLDALNADSARPKDDTEVVLCSFQCRPLTVPPRGSEELNNVEKSNESTVKSSEVRKQNQELISELRDIVRNVSGYDQQKVRSKLEQFFEMRLSNGDTFLHAILNREQPNFKYIVEFIQSMKMPHLLNLPNDLQQTILHLAVINDQPQLVAFLISKGCDPMLGDHEGNNVIHYAAMCQTSLRPLLEAITSNTVSCDLNATNHEKQTALHLAAIYDSESSARLLLEHGASCDARDYHGRTPLHLAVYDDHLDVAKALLDFVLSSDIDHADGRGYTALQVACCGKMKQNSLEIIKLLLEKKADPLKHQEHNEPAWKLAECRPTMRALVMKGYVRAHSAPSDDEFVSADEGDIEDDFSNLKIH